MNVSIQERTFSVRSEYDIQTPNSKLFAQMALFSLGPSIKLKSEAGDVIATIRGRSLFGTSYDFLFSDGRAYNYHSEKFWKGVYVLEADGGAFNYYKHRGLRSSIFLNDRQIAAITKNSFVVGTGNEYDIQMDSDADVNLVICMVLAMNTSRSDTARARVFRSTSANWIQRTGPTTRAGSRHNRGCQPGST